MCDNYSSILECNESPCIWCNNTNKCESGHCSFTISKRKDIVILFTFVCSISVIFLLLKLNSYLISKQVDNTIIKKTLCTIYFIETTPVFIVFTQTNQNTIVLLEVLIIFINFIFSTTIHHIS
jgi:hypothetical protein